MFYTHLRNLLLLWGLLSLLPAGALAQYSRPVPGKYTSIVYRPADGYVYATAFDEVNFVGSNFRVVAVDPATAQVVQQWPLSQAGFKLALSDDGSVLYCVAGDSIHRYNFAAGSFDLHFSNQLPPGLGTHAPLDLHVLPGQPNLLVGNWTLSELGSPNIVAVYDNGVIRPNTAQQFTDFGAIATDGTRVFAYDTYSSGSSVYVFDIDANGLTALPGAYGSVRESAVGIQYFDGRVYGSEGAVLDVESNGVLRAAGRFRTLSARSTIVPFAPGSDTVYVYSVSGLDVWLQKFDRNNFQLLQQYRLARVFPPYQPDELVTLGHPEVLAVRSLSNLVLMNRCVSQITAVAPFASEVQYGCLNDTLHLTAPGNFADDQYYWSNGHRGQTFTRFNNNLTATRLSYQVADAAGCLSPPSPEVEVQVVLPLPAVQIGSPIGNTVCAGGFVELTAYGAFDQRLVTYEWSDGQTGTTIRVETAGAYRCWAISPQGCRSQDSQDPYLVTSSSSTQPPQPVLSVLGGDGDEIVCSADNAKLVAPAGFTTYVWSDGTVQVFQNERPIPAGDAPISVQVATAAGCLSEHSEALLLERYTTPPQPTIQRVGTLLASSAAAGNQWFFNDVPIPGATGQFLNISESGVYTVQVVLNAGCPSPVSEPFSY